MYHKNKFSINRIGFVNKIIQVLLIYSCMTLFFVVLKNTVSPVFGVIKDVGLIVSMIFLMSANMRFKKKHLGIIALFLFIIYFSWFMSLSYSDSLFVYFYQFKIDFFYILSLFVFFIVFRKINDKNVAIYLKIIIVFSFINAVVAIAQRLLMFKFLGLVGFENLDINNIPALGNIDGLVLQTQNGLLRSIGTMSTPMACAELSFVGLFIFLYYKFKFSFSGFFIVLVFVSAIYFTGYKTVYLSSFFVLLSFVFYSFRLAIIKVSGICLMLFGFLSVNTSVIYDVFRNISPVYAEYSIKLRYDFVVQVYEKYIENFPFGLYAQNGNYLESVNDAIPLDSMYIYILSNYGLIGVICSLALLFLLYSNIKMINIRIDNKDIPVGQYVFIFYTSNYFFNQPFVNFPSGWIALIILMIGLMQRKGEKQHVIH